MDIIFNPPANEENRYIQLLVNELRAKGYRIHPLDTIFSSRKHFRSIKLVHLNWFENIDDRGFFVALRSFLRKLTVLAVIRLSGKPLIWTLHNRVSHEKGAAFFSHTLIRLLVRWSDRIIIHSGQSEAVLATYGAQVSERVIHLPHPHFIGAYGDTVSATTRQGDNLDLLFIGMVKPYKNLELLIDVVRKFGPHVRLTIAGKAIDESYQQTLASRAENTGNVTLLPYFIPDGEIAGMLGEADAVVSPYDLASSLNSGTVILAFSYKKTVICPEIGTISGLGSRMVDTFCYRYGTDEEHRMALTQQIEQALVRKRDDPAALDQMGERLYKHVAAAHDPHRIGDELDRIYHYFVDKDNPKRVDG
ncbi:glycosyltransferase family 4 protein [Parapedobacter sp. 10938]|uniref:glycosyltransferase family 4 protein n=1 Tax=Parapedobacter flavus TaxID=3110225 RepID=UPI002DBCE0F4|nr:glycosyltransferase family 4 protein [Parapedobacter sp. 10938]MEC3881229.1 glycosyltransferase family 4 protein [Parapedobacter sp. 10938]